MDRYPWYKFESLPGEINIRKKPVDLAGFLLLINMPLNIEIISAPSILGLKPNGVEHLGESLKHAGLATKLQATVKYVPTLNADGSIAKGITNCIVNALP